LVSVLVYFFAAAVYLSMRPADDHSQEVKYLLVSFPIVFFQYEELRMAAVRRLLKNFILDTHKNHLVTSWAPRGALPPPSRCG